MLIAFVAGCGAKEGILASDAGAADSSAGGGSGGSAGAAVDDAAPEAAAGSGGADAAPADAAAEACPTGFGACDNNEQNGCETDLLHSIDHCGQCQHKCSALGGTPSCKLGVCAITCSADNGDCDDNAENGCESNVKTDPLHCGDCTNDCKGSDCVNGVCSPG